MSWGAVEWAKTWNGELSSSEAFVLFIIAEHFNEKELRAWPKVVTIEGLTRLSKATILRAIKSLEQKGLIQTEHWRSTGGQKQANRYCLPWYKQESSARRESVRSDQYFDHHGNWTIDEVLDVSKVSR